MSQELSTIDAQQSNAPSGLCRVCGRRSSSSSTSDDLPQELRSIVAANSTSLDEVAKVCLPCVEMFRRGQAQLEAHASIFQETSYVLPTPLRMQADERFTGRNVTMAFLDSGFYRHDDLTKPNNRIVGYHSIFDPTIDQTSLESTDVASWHGMMTSVVASGNGYLSQGFYKGIASDANLVLVKIGRTGHISEANIERGLQWVIDHREEFGIRIV